MIYYKDEKALIRDMEPSDAQILFDECTALGWHSDTEYYHMRMQEAAEGKCVALAAEVQGKTAGTLYLYKCAAEGPFRGKNIPEIVDFSVLPKYRQRGIGGKLMDTAEKLAQQYGDTVCLGVGLSREYGSAQRMYVKRGYIPDGSGVWYQNKQCVQYETVCTIDDDLCLFLSKKLKG